MARRAVGIKCWMPEPRLHVAVEVSQALAVKHGLVPTLKS